MPSQTVSSRVTLDIHFARDPENHAGLLYLDHDGSERYITTLRVRDLPSTALEASGVQQQQHYVAIASVALLPYFITVECPPGAQVLLRGRTTSNILWRTVAMETPNLQRHVIDTLLDRDKSTVGLSQFDHISDSVPRDVEHDYDFQPIAIGDDEQGTDEQGTDEQGTDVLISSVVGALSHGAFSFGVESHYDEAVTAAIASGLVTEAHVDTLTDMLARTSGGQAREQLMKAQLWDLFIAQTEASRTPTRLMSLPHELLEVILLHLQSCESAHARGLSRCSATCRVLHQVADIASKTFASSVGITLSIARCPSHILRQRRHAVRALHARLISLPTSIGPRNGSQLTIGTLASELHRFDPLLCDPCVQLVLPRFTDVGSQRGEAEYANLTAILSGGVGYSKEESCKLAIQRMIEGGWAEGLDPEGAEAFEGVLVGKPSATNPVGACDLSVGLLHRRMDVSLIDVRSGQGAIRALFGAVAALLKRRDGQGTRLPLLLQWAGHSRVVVGVTQEPGYEALLYADPMRPGMVALMVVAELEAAAEADGACIDLQLLVVHSDGSNRLSTQAAFSRSPLPIAISAYHRDVGRRWTIFRGQGAQLRAQQSSELELL